MRGMIVIFLFVFCIVSSYSQAVHFESLTWQQSLAKAKKEHRMLFIEMYTAWCTYCKQMEQTVFSAPEAGDFYNRHFINVRFDAQHYDGIRIRKSYAMLGFPTFLYLDPDGLVMLKTAGYQNRERFINNGDSAVSVYQKKLSSSFYKQQ